jgi:acyl-coenzyme A synthetase/AMP-(fatty) acid ligase
LRLLKKRPRNFEKIDYLRLTGAYCSIATRIEGQKTLAHEILTSFGATEIGRVAWGRLAEIQDVEGSVGRLIGGIEAETVGEDGKPLPSGSEGEIRIKPPRAAVAAYPSVTGDQTPLRDGWFYPGDLGRIDAGHLIVTGRKSLVINLGGNKVSPEVAEEIIQRADGVDDVGVLGVKDQGGFDVVCAVIVKGDSEVNLETLNRFVRSNKGNFSVSKLKFVPAIPRAESGKIEREKLKELVS